MAIFSGTSATLDPTTNIRPTGKSNGGFIKIADRWVPSFDPDRFYILVSLLSARKHSASGVPSKNIFNLVKSSLNYNLYSSTATDLIFKPAFYIERNAGEDPYTGFRNQGITSVGMKVSGAWN